MARDDALQYALLALVSGLESYTGAKLRQSEREQQGKLQHPNADLDRQLLKSRIESEGALTDQRKASAQRQSTSQTKDADYYMGLVKSLPPDQRAGVLNEVHAAMTGGSGDYLKAQEIAKGRFDKVDSEYPLPTSDVMSYDPKVLAEAMKARESNRKARMTAQTFLGLLQGNNYKYAGIPGAPALGGAGGAGGGGAAMGGAAMGQPQQQVSPGQAQQQQAQQGLTPRASVDAQMGPAKFTEPRMPTEQLAETNRQTMQQAPQGQGTMPHDTIAAGDFAWASTVIEQAKHDQSVPFEWQAHAWFVANKVTGVPIPAPFKQFLTSQGVSREILDSGPVPQSYSRGMQPQQQVTRRGAKGYASGAPQFIPEGSDIPGLPEPTGGTEMGPSEDEVNTLMEGFLHGQSGGGVPKRSKGTSGASDRQGMRNLRLEQILTLLKHLQTR